MPAKKAERGEREEAGLLLAWPELACSLYILHCPVEDVRCLCGVRLGPFSSHGRGVTCGIDTCCPECKEWNGELISGAFNYQHFLQPRCDAHSSKRGVNLRTLLFRFSLSQSFLFLTWGG